MQQVTNLLKELKNNSSSGAAYTSHTQTTNGANAGGPPYDEKSLKLQDLEKTTSQIYSSSEMDKLRGENQVLRKKVDQLEKDLELQRGDLANMTKQKQSKADLATYYLEHSKNQASQIKKLESRLETSSRDLIELTQENEKLRIEKRALSDSLRNSLDEKETLLQKAGQYKANLKQKDSHLRELLGDLDDKQRTIRGLEEQTEKLINALKKQRNYEEKLLSDHFSHLDQQIQQLQVENHRLKKMAFNSKSSNIMPSISEVENSDTTKRSRSPNQGKDQFMEDLLRELHLENRSQIIPAIKELKNFQKKHSKERKLISNLQKLVKDCISFSDIANHGNASTIETKPSAATLNTAGLKSNFNEPQIAPYSTVMHTANSTIDVSGLTQANPGNVGFNTIANQTRTMKNELAMIGSEMPKLTDVWREFIQLKQQLQDNNQNETLKALLIMLHCDELQDLFPAVQGLIQHHGDSERVIKLIRQRYKLSKKASIEDIELHLLQKIHGTATTESKPNKKISKTTSGLLPTQPTTQLK